MRAGQEPAPPMMVGIGIGGWTTDAVMLENGGIQLVTIEANDPVAAAAGALGKLVADFGIRLEDVECVAATGAGSRVLTKSLLGRPVIKVNEFTAIGIGGTSLAGQKNALVVSLGTGTAIVSVTDDKIAHFSGTGVGGGTLLGLAKHMLGVSTIERLEKLARKGDLRRIDLSVRDIAGGAIGDLPPSTTAANFGKISAHSTPEDKALAIMKMIVESIGLLALASARACGQENIVLSGKLSPQLPFMQQLNQLDFPFSRPFVLAETADFAP